MPVCPSCLGSATLEVVQTIPFTQGQMLLLRKHACTRSYLFGALCDSTLGLRGHAWAP